MKSEIKAEKKKPKQCNATTENNPEEIHERKLNHK